MKPLFSFLISLILLLASYAIIDGLIGLTFDKIIDELPNNGNDTGAIAYAVKKVDYPVLIVGSSRAKEHYFPNIIRDSLSLETYNVGLEGYYLSYHCCLINMLLDRYIPDIIIWDLNMNSLFANSQDPISVLKPYYWDFDVVRRVINEKYGESSRIKLLSNAYRYNGLAIDMLYKWFDGSSDVDLNNGMNPLIYKGYSVDPELTVNKDLDGPIDTNRVVLLHNTLQRLSDEGVRVFIFDSPNYVIIDPNRDKSSESIIYKECQFFSIPVFDNRNIDYFLDHPELFYDKGHLFDDGAFIYSQIAAHQIVQELSSGNRHISLE